MKTKLTNTTINNKGVARACIQATVKGEANDCTVRALAAATGSSYREAHTYAKKKWKRESRSAVPAYVFIKDFLSGPVLGHTFTPIGDKECQVQIGGMIIKMKRPVTLRNIRGQITEKKMTLKTLLKKHPEGTFYVTVRKHAFAVKDGVVIGNEQDAENLKEVLVTAFKVE